MSDVIRQESRSDSQLERDGFKEYPRKKELVMARKLPASEAPLKVKTAWGEILVAQAGYMICYDTGDKYAVKPEDYDHWPVEPQIFEKTYKTWDEAFAPTKAQEQLMKMGCKPYYKAVGVHAKLLETGVYIQSLEHEKPVLVPEKRVLAIGAEGEPYHMGDKTFHDRYDGTLTEKPNSLRKLVKRLVNFFKAE